MRRTRFLLPALALGLMFGARPAVAHAQSMDKSDKSAMGAMKDTSAMKHDAMGKDAMSHDTMARDGMHDEAAMGDTAMQKAKKGKTRPAGGMSDKATMAEPSKMSHP